MSRRITPYSTEQCQAKIPNQFEVAIIAARRMRELNSGASPMIKVNGEHNMTIAMMEITAGRVGREYLFK